MNDRQSQEDTQALAQILEGDQHHYHHQLKAPDFSHHHKSDNDGHRHDVHALDLPVGGDDDDMHTGGEEELDLALGDIGTPDMDASGRTNSFGRPPSIRKACDLCHAAKQKCSGDRPSCTRCTAGGWQCVYAPRQRRRTVPKDQKLTSATLDPSRSQNLASLASTPVQSGKKRKLGQRDSQGFGSDGIDMKTAMGIAMDMGLAGEEEGEDLLTMGDEQMLESIAIDGYLADLPLATFVHNLAFTAAQTNDTSFNAEDFPSGGDAAFPPADMDQHTTSALRDAIFSLNESSGGVATHGEGAGDDHHGGDGPDDPQGMDPHLALLDLSHAMPGEGGPGTGGNDGGGDGLNLPNLSSSTFSSSGCTHQPVVTHILALLTQHPLEQKPGSNTPLTLAVFAPLARSLRLFRALSTCTTCSTSPRETLPQLALLSRTTTILTFPFPPINSSSVGSSAQITVHGARLSGTGLSEAIEQHIVGVVWDSWRAAIREIFATLERKAQEIMTQSAEMSAGENGQPGGNSAETQRAGLMGAMMFQAMSRLVTAMDEVEGN